MPEFIETAQDIYGYRHFINDAGGSVCELEAPEVLETLAAHTLILYIKATPEQEELLIERARRSPKPLYYREAFLDEKLPEFLRRNGCGDGDRMPPDEFVAWVFPELFRSRLPRYQDIADRYGYTVGAETVAQVRNDQDFVDLVADALAA